MSKIITRSLMIIFIFLINSCTTYQSPESITDKISRINPKIDQTQLTPEIPVITYQYNNNNNNRNLASASTSATTNTANQESLSQPPSQNQSQPPAKSMYLSFSNRKLYFMTLYDQYRTLKTFITNNSENSMNDIELCPQFHSGLLHGNNGYWKNKSNKSLPFPLTTEGRSSSNSNNTNLISHYPISKNIQKAKSLALYPELTLPITFNSKHPNVYEFISTNINRNNNNNIIVNNEEQMKFFVDAFKLHLGKNLKELKEMCEYGQSDQYFLFENLITHMKNNVSFRKSKESMEALLKTTIISNMAIIVSLDLELIELANNDQSQLPPQSSSSSQHRLPSSLISSNSTLDSLQQEVLTRLDAGWSKQYFDEIIRLKLNNK
ncbi:MAG: hypothetical protein HQK51_14580 [Oligoflexia bacterium]|nr:hypothetical protein [Oligoflexia bacterium]